MNLWEDPVNGKFHTGLYKNKSHPPVLVIELTTTTQFGYMQDILVREQFLRVRKVGARFGHLVINTVGDAIEIDPGVLDFESCALNVEVDVEDPTDKMLVQLDNAPVWSLLFTRKEEAHTETSKIAILVDKTTEEIIYRRHVKAKK